MERPRDTTVYKTKYSLWNPHLSKKRMTYVKKQEQQRQQKPFEKQQQKT